MVTFLHFLPSKRYPVYVHSNAPPRLYLTKTRPQNAVLFAPSQTNNGIHQPPTNRITYYFFIPKIFLFFFSLSLWSLVSLCRPLSDPPAPATDDDA